MGDKSMTYDIISSWDNNEMMGTVHMSFDLDIDAKDEHTDTFYRYCAMLTWATLRKHDIT